MDMGLVFAVLEITYEKHTQFGDFAKSVELTCCGYERTRRRHSWCSKCRQRCTHIRVLVGRALVRSCVPSREPSMYRHDWLLHWHPTININTARMILLYSVSRMMVITYSVEWTRSTISTSFTINRCNTVGYHLVYTKIRLECSTNTHGRSQIGTHL